MNIFTGVSLSLVAIAISFAAFAIRKMWYNKQALPFLIVAIISMVLSIPFMGIGVSLVQDERDAKTYSAWVKHTENPNNLTFDEWKALNGNYVPRGKYERRTKSPETY